MTTPWWLKVYVAIACTFSVLPLAVLVLLSFTSDLFVKFPPSGFGVQWYLTAFADSSLTGALLYSVVTASIVSLVSIVLGGIASAAITRYQTRATKFIEAMLLSPLMIAHLVLGISILSFLGSAGVSIAPTGLVAVQILIVMPFVMRYMLASLSELSLNTEHASAGLGASGFYTIRRVLLPQIAPGIIAGAIVAFLVAFNEVDAALFLTQPGFVTLPVELFKDVQSSLAPTPVAASAVSTLVAVAIVLVLDRTMGLLKILVGMERKEEV